jgi:hypothetical protein
MVWQYYCRQKVSKWALFNFILVKQLALNGLTTYEYDYPITNGVRKKLLEDGYSLNNTILEGTTIIGW